MYKIAIWIQAFRLRTLPLALSSAVLGSFLAFADGDFKWPVFSLTILTTILLQILSNLANDYGDSVNGVDNNKRVGPERTVQSGKISKSEMKNLLILFVVLSFISGSILIFLGLKNAKASHITLFFILGILSILAAIKYTIGKRPYGYSGLGDLSVFIFFGIVGVCGTYYLHTNHFYPLLLLPAASIGFLSAGVLNLNNMRDIINDAATGKKTLVVRIGSTKAKFYHLTLIIISMVLAIIHTVVTWESLFQLFFLLTAFPLSYHLYQVFYNHIPVKLNNQLKFLAITTFLFSVFYSLGIFIIS
jgi:1,4-dihydroxy-2-naphthoate octaprenyltransferase